MASTEPAVVVRRLLEDDYVHEQLAQASAGVRGAYRRIRHLPPEKAVQDEALYDRLRQAATGAMQAALAALGKPERKPKRRNPLPALVVLGATVAVVVWATKRDAAKPPAAGRPAGVPPVAPA
jgi:hypothetical protein